MLRTKVKLTKNGVLAIQSISFLAFLLSLYANRYEAVIPDFVQGLGYGLCIGGFLIVIANLKLLKGQADE